MKTRAFLALAASTAIAYTLGAQGRPEPKVEISPHAAAIELVLKTQQARIRDADKEDWLHDVKERAWVVKRPFYPGIIDSTQMFNVSYRIDGKEVAAWLVDMAKKQVQPVDLKAKRS